MTRWWWMLMALVAAAAALYVLAAREPFAGFAEGDGLSLSRTLAGDAEGYARAIERREFRFPADHGPHPGFKTEWWYITGNLETAAGRAFGFQFTLFRSALTPEPRERASRWAADQAFMAHLAVTDVEGKRFHAFERFARGAMDLAGAEGLPLRLWIEDWHLKEAGPGRIPGLPRMRLTAFEDGVGLNLELDSRKPVVLQGDQGLSRKGREPGNASYYYSMTRLEAKGNLRVPGEEFEVTGRAWIDREWSTSVLEEGQVGWDWFALQLDSGEELMFYQMRRRDGSADPLSKGCWVDAAGTSALLRFEDLSLEILEEWKNRDGDVYPACWRLSIPSRQAVLDVDPLLADQELRFGIRYWEGAVAANGTVAGSPVRGKGYVELTGYRER